MNYKRISFVDVDTGEVLGNALLGENEELIVKSENRQQVEAIRKRLKLSQEMQKAKIQVLDTMYQKTERFLPTITQSEKKSLY